MKRGLVIGKFMPVHHGHIALIEFASTQCDELIVSMSYKEDDPIAHELRLSWLQGIFRGRDSIRIYVVPDDFDDESASLSQRTKQWSYHIKRIFPPVDILFASEPYGEPFALHLGAEYQPFDPGRIRFPVSATQIRNAPLQYWSFIPEPVRPFFVKKICFYGPESTGKSSSAIEMAARYETNYVPEVAREMISSNEFTVEDIVAIGHAQFERIEEKLLTANKLLFCDTDAITTQIYSQHYLGVVPEVLYEIERKVRYDVYFLMDIDVPWIADGLRDLGDRREEMMGIFKDELDKRNLDYVLVTGSSVKRKEIIDKEIRSLLS
jgi:HTH-type transcriptional repressor of NAD biosynthesis genes